MAPPQQQFGLTETRPPLAAMLRPRFNIPGLNPSAAAASAAGKISSTYDLVEPMRFLYVHVVKARDLPAVSPTGSIDPFVEVKLGNFKGTTAVLAGHHSPSWHQVFAFSATHLQSHLLEVAVKAKDLAGGDDMVGRIGFDLSEVPVRVPPDSPLAPQWYRLDGKRGEKLHHGEIMLSLVYLRVAAIGAQDLVPHDTSRPMNASVKLQLAGQVRRTRPGGPPGTPNPMWNEEFMFVASEPFDEPLLVTVEDRVGPGRDEPLGRIMLPLNAAMTRHDHFGKPVEPRWYSLARPSDDGEKKEGKFASKIQLRMSLDFGYHVLDESTYYSSDLQPSSKHTRKPSIGILEVGVLGARNLIPMKAKDGRSTDAYCVAKYGPKWVRTRTIMNTLNPQWNEQYTWEVFDPCTVITVVVFDNSQIGSKNGDARDESIGKVRIRLSTLETDRVYTHFYPLLALKPSGLKKTGELHLAVRFTCTAWVNMMAMYGRPLLPKMHYSQPISVMQLDYLRHQAMQIVSARLSRAEPPLRREVVEYTLDVGSHMFSLRRSKANFYRITSLFCGFASMAKWYDGIRSWRNPITTMLVHMLFLILICYPELILPTIFLYMFMIGLWNYRFRSRHPPHMDTKLSQAEFTHPDELDEEFDTFPSNRPADIVRLRYDRLRSVGGRVQTVVGDLATQGERAHALLSWRDPRATAIFIFLSLVVAIVLYVTPFQVLLVITMLYLLRHPRFRSRMPSVPFNFYRRLPAKSDSLI
uniref:C2 domain-containing protein n=1 Tax=Aegilops tauschii TaxID=37682 RepID=N1R154_AEGTA